MKIFPIIQSWWDLELFAVWRSALAFLSYSKPICSTSARPIFVKFAYIVGSHIFPRHAKTHHNTKCTFLAKCGQLCHFSQCDAPNSRIFPFSKPICSKLAQAISVKFSHIVQRCTVPRYSKTHQNVMCTFLAKCGQLWHFSQCEVPNSRFFPCSKPVSYTHLTLPTIYSV